MKRAHEYRVSNRWTGNLGTGTSAYTAYSRNHELSGSRKGAAIACSSDAVFRGDGTRFSPEELLVGALSACHMLWVLHLCADAGIAVAAYDDDAIGHMIEHEDGSGEFTRVLLRPRLVIHDARRADDVQAIHERAHQLCFLARSMNFPVDHEPSVTAGAV